MVKIKEAIEYRDYLNTLPLHHSKKEIITEESDSVFQYEFRPTHNFTEEVYRMNKNGNIF